MELKTVRIESNDDGTFQVCCETEYGDTFETREKPLKYSAASLDEVIDKIKEAKEEFSKKKDTRKKRDRDVSNFIKG
jgi:hypothetical protein